MTTKYQPLTQEINACIEVYNSFLLPEFRVGAVELEDANSSLRVEGIPWDKLWWPADQALPGVYVLLGYHSADPKQLGCYIGKASLGNVGRRLYKHLRPFGTTGRYSMNDRKSEPFVIELLSIIGIRNEQMSPFACALEEFLIVNVGKRIHLFNRAGNRP